MAKARARAAHKFDKSVFMSASLTLSKSNDRTDTEHEVERIYVGFTENKAALKAVGHCGEEEFVCFVDELPEVIAFLNEIVATHKRS